MIGGVVLHSAVMFMVSDVGWPVRDHARSVLADLCVLVLHGFRMPLFFVLAGFFAARTLSERGAAVFLRRRARRVLLPLLFAFAVILPLVRVSWPVSEPFRPAHLWFLEHLICLDVLASVLAAGLAAARFEIGARLLAWRPFRGVVFATAAGALLLWTMGGAPLDVDTVVPSLRMLAYHALFYGFGAVLCSHASLLAACARRAWHLLSAAALAGIFSLWLTAGGRPGPSLLASGLASIPASVYAWASVLGLIGLGTRAPATASPLFASLSRASYGIYLVHLPLVLALQRAVAPLNYAWPVKLAAIVAGALGGAWVIVRLWQRSGSGKDVEQAIESHA
jgi:peptidoglycan/LPS O-acetylase OafA/YrhL